MGETVVCCCGGCVGRGRPQLCRPVREGLDTSFQGSHHDGGEVAWCAGVHMLFGQYHTEGNIDVRHRSVCRR